MSLDNPPVEHDSTARTSTHVNNECWSKPNCTSIDNTAARPASGDAGAAGTDQSKALASNTTVAGAKGQGTVMASAEAHMSPDGKQILPAITIDNASVQKLESQVMNSSASAQDRLKAVKSLVDHGINSFEIKDDGGHSARVRMESEKVGDKNLVHLFLDGEGREKVGLRGVADSKGEMHQQRDEKGDHVSYGGKGKDRLDSMHAAFESRPQVAAPVASAPIDKQGEKADVPQATPPVVPTPPRPEGGQQQSPRQTLKVEPQITAKPPEVPAPSKPQDKPLPPAAPAKPQDKPLPPAAAERPQDKPLPPAAAERPAETDDLRLRHGSGQRDGADAVVRVPENFDPSKPIHLEIYNHGYGTTAGKDFDKFNMDQAMKNAPPNTVLIVPEWQRSPDSRNPSQGDLTAPGKYDAMVQEAFNKTPALAGKTLKDVDSVSIQSHSAGYMPTLTQLNNNRLGDKVKSITLLDSDYTRGGFNNWIKNNIHDLAAGNKQFNNIYTGHSGTMGHSREQEQYVSQLLNHNGLPRTQLLDANGDGSHALTAGDFARHSMVFKYSSASAANMGEHWRVPYLYFPIINQANGQR